MPVICRSVTQISEMPCLCPSRSKNGSHKITTSVFDCFAIATKYFGEQGWRSGESARLPPMGPRFDSQTRRHMWDEFVVGSRPCSEGFAPGSLVFLPPQKSTFLNSNYFDREFEGHGFVSLWLLCATLPKQSHYYYYYHYHYHYHYHNHYHYHYYYIYYFTSSNNKKFFDANKTDR